jgi:hypothetical protein
VSKRRNSDNGSVAVLDEPEAVEAAIEATLDPDSPIQGPILEPQEIEVYEHEHYAEIRRRNEDVRLLDEQHDRAKSAAKRAKDALDEAQSELSDFISRGASVPGRQYAKRVRLVKDVQADTELGKDFVTLTKGEVYDVHDIEGDNVAVLVTGVVNFLELGEFEVIDWSASPPKPEDVAANAWRSLSIGELIQHGCKPSVNEKLLDAGIATIGSLIDFQADGTELTSIKGIAGETEAQIADAMIAFWEAHPEYAQNAAQ